MSSIRRSSSTRALTKMPEIAEIKAQIEDLANRVSALAERLDVVIEVVSGNDARLDDLIRPEDF